MKRHHFLLLLFSIFILISGTIAQINFEFRGVWIATVENIDWPKEKGLSIEEQKSSFIKLLEKHQQNGINTIIMQIRPAADAFYASPFEPWSEYLSGKQGVAPYPLYDPLAFMIEETHKRGMEFHAWINPYRAVFNLKHSSVAANHITHIHPEWFLNYGNTKYFNPGLPEVREYVTKVVKDLIEKYNVDGLHMDDYFYPYRITGKEFPDEKTYHIYGHGLSKNEWRRSNCDSIIKNIYDIVTTTNSHVKFGISPFGVWRNKNQDADGSNTTAGTTCYDDLYADILLWLKNGWIDYVTPQIYWECSNKVCPYNELLDWWSKHTFGKHLYIGHGLYKANINAAWKDKNELPRQIQAIRKNENVLGSAFFSSQDLIKNINGWADSLRYNYYTLPALIPSMDWIDSALPAKPIVSKSDSITFKLENGSKEKIKGFAIFALPALVDEKIEYATLIKIITTDNEANYNISKSNVPTNNRLFVVSVSINNNISEWVELKEMLK